MSEKCTCNFYFGCDKDEVVEALRAVYKLNMDLYSDEMFNKIGQNIFNFYTDGFYACVTFMDESVWSTEDSTDRGYDEEKDDYTESIYDYCMRKAKEYVENLNKILNHKTK